MIYLLYKSVINLVELCNGILCSGTTDTCLDFMCQCGTSGNLCPGENYFCFGGTCTGLCIESVLKEESL